MPDLVSVVQFVLPDHPEQEDHKVNLDVVDRLDHQDILAYLENQVILVWLVIPDLKETKAPPETPDLKDLPVTTQSVDSVPKDLKGQTDPAARRDPVEHPV